MIGYLDLWTGLSGDMMVGALIGAGWPDEDVQRTFAAIGMTDASLTIERRNQHGIVGIGIRIDAVGEPAERSWREIRGLLEGSTLDRDVRERSLLLLRRVIEVEAGIHGMDPEKVHLHELGAIDSIADVVLTVAGLAALRVETLACGAVPLSRGSIDSAHGRVPAPAPATLKLLEGCPVRWLDLEGEWLTPTGALILSEVAEAGVPPPAMVLRRVGTGAGTRRIHGSPNVVRLLIGDPLFAESRGAGHGSAGETPEGNEVPGLVSILETDLDDQDPRQLAAIVAGLETLGALEVLRHPVVMKKGRLGTVVTVLCRPEDELRLGDALLRESTTLGVRIRREVRRELRRWTSTVATPYGPVRIKWSLPGGVPRPRAEFEDMAALASRAGVPIWEVERAVLRSIDPVVPQVPEDSPDRPA